MTTMTIEEYHAALKAQGTKDRAQLVMICPMCRTLQTGNDLIRAGAGKTFEDVEKYLGFSCVGRFTGAGSPRKNPDGNPCNWTLGGLFSTHELEIVTPDGQRHPRFEVASPDQAQAHWAKAPPDEHALALWAVEQLRRFGGVLEHPSASGLWREAQLPEPGWLPDEWGGWTLECDQFHWGHLARKRTRLYIVGAKPSDLPPIPHRDGEPTHCVSSLAGKRMDKDVRKRLPTWKPELGPNRRDKTPPAFAAWLVAVARLCKHNARPHAEARSADSVQADVGNDLEQGTHKSQPADLPLRSGAIGAGGAVDIQRTTAAPLPVSNARPHAEERSDDSVQADVGRFRHLPPANEEPAHPLASYYCDECGEPDWIDTHQRGDIREFYADDEMGDTICESCMRKRAANARLDRSETAGGKECHE